MGIPGFALESNFMKGLKKDIRAALWPLRPRGLSKTMILAQLVEEIQQSNGRRKFHM